MFSYNPPIAPCYPLLWGGGILVDHWSTISSFIISPAPWSCWRASEGILVSLHPSVRLASRVRSIAATVLVGSISYLYILQATSEGVLRVKFLAKFQFYFGNILKFVTWLCLVLTWDLMRITSMGNHGAARGISERSRSSCSSYYLNLQKQTLVNFIEKKRKFLRKRLRICN